MYTINGQKRNHMALKNLILKRMENADRSSVWTAIDFLDLGNRDAIDKTLQRLVNNKVLRRIDRGLYDIPRINNLTNQPNAPDYQKIINAIAQRDQVRILIDGLTCANELGLTNLVSGKIEILTDGRLRPITIQNLTIQFKHTAPSKLYWADKSSMRIIQALYWLKDVINSIDSTERQGIKNKLVTILTNSDQKEKLLSELHQGLYTLPSWMHIFLKEIFSIVES
jgi:hypothetical protein